MTIPFTKMQALENDFVLIEERNLESPLSKTQIRWIADRRKGIGCDQLILLKDSEHADAAISFYNADGSSATTCGNGTRCVARYLGKESGLIQTPSFLSEFTNQGESITISLKEPTFRMLKDSPYYVDVGNPHFVIFGQNLSYKKLEDLAVPLQFPQKINVELAQIISPSVIKVLVWERGVGITPACGSGACAVGVVSVKLRLVKNLPLSIEMEGGTLTVNWKEGSPILLTGPANYCFKGMVNLP